MTTITQQQEAVVANMRSLAGRCVYTNAYVAPTMAQMLKRLAGDCSDVTHASYEPLGYEIGGMSYDQAKAGTEIGSWTGARGHGIAAFNRLVAKLQPGDLVCMALDPTRPGVITHVEMIAAAASTTSLGHGGPGKGPTEHQVTASWLIGAATKWTVRRIIIDQQEEEDMNQEQSAALDAIKAKTDAIWKWMGGGSNATEFYKIKQNQTQQTADIAALKAAVGTLAASQGLDADAVTDAINAAVAAALKDISITLTTEETA